MSHLSNHGRPWEPEDEKRLAFLHTHQRPLAAIAAELERTEASVRERLTVLRAQGVITTRAVRK